MFVAIRLYIFPEKKKKGIKVVFTKTNKVITHTNNITPTIIVMNCNRGKQGDTILIMTTCKPLNFFEQPVHVVQ